MAPVGNQSLLLCYIEVIVFHFTHGLEYIQHTLSLFSSVSVWFFFYTLHDQQEQLPSVHATVLNGIDSDKKKVREGDYNILVRLFSYLYCEGENHHWLYKIWSNQLFPCICHPSELHTLVTTPPYTHTLLPPVTGWVYGSNCLFQVSFKTAWCSFINHGQFRVK